MVVKILLAVSLVTASYLYVAGLKKDVRTLEATRDNLKVQLDIALDANEANEKTISDLQTQHAFALASIAEFSKDVGSIQKQVKDLKNRSKPIVNETCVASDHLGVIDDGLRELFTAAPNRDSDQNSKTQGAASLD